MNRTYTHGFTLIEILIIIAVIGVLGSIIISVLDPAEMIRRSEDAARKIDVRNLAKAIESYSIDNGQYPQEANNWQTQLLLRRYIRTELSDPANYRRRCTSFRHRGYCYDINEPERSWAIIWTVLESKTETAKAGEPCTSDPSSNDAVYVYNSQNNSFGYLCVGTDNTRIPGVNEQLE